MKANHGKTIVFKQREEHHISKYNFKANEYGKIDFKVIPYPKYKKVLRKGRKFIKIKNLFIILLILLIASSYFIITNKRLSYLIDKKYTNSISTSNNNIVSNDEFNIYSKIIESQINTLIPLNYEHNIKTQAMHKNGSYLYAQGVISSRKNNNVYFDIILKDDKSYSLIINNTEYIKR
ncbi:hypothetical protein [Romboutsia ilealis]|uniref:hypothetical protein n=1 Tax=Romboutsia ilealis TaxID=1115758 RepID=UPI002572AB39|nr:hypothetical protein [Romboutsia ilealis]